jgi:hypothetical protein
MPGKPVKKVLMLANLVQTMQQLVQFLWIKLLY